MANPNVHHLTSVRRTDRWRALHQAGTTVWFTGRHADHAAAIARRIEARLLDAGRSAYLLDEDTLRHGLCSDLGTGRGDQDELVRRAAELARLFADAGMAVLVVVTSPSARLRDWVRGRHEQDQLPFIEVFTRETPSREGDERFAPPADPEITLAPSMTEEQAVEVVLARVIRELRRGRHLP